MGGRKICLWKGEEWSYNEGEYVRSEEWVVMRYSSVLDLHTHTVASGHAYCSLREMAKVASEKGLEVLGVTGLVGTYPLFMALKSVALSGSNEFLLFVIVCFMCFMLSFYTAVAAISKTSLFPPQIRALGAGLGCMISVGLFGGSVNYVALQFKALGIEWGFFVYFGVIACISLICTALIPKQRELD